MKTTARLAFVFLLILAAQLVQAQRVGLYFGDYSAAAAGSITWSRVTHLYYAFLNPMTTTGAVNTATTVWYNHTNFTNTVSSARSGNANIKIIISVGGAPGSDANITSRLNTIFASASARAQMQNDLIAFIQTNNLDGMDLDLEHPVSAAEKNNHETFLSEMKTKLNALEITMCKELELSMALNGETNHFLVNPTGSDFVNPTAINYVDIVNLMTYDMATTAHNNPNHSPLVFAQEAVTAFAAAPFNWPKSKMMIGIPFYGRNSSGTASNYNVINGANSAAIYADADDLVGGQYFNACPTIQNKVNYAKADGLAGVVVWEAGGDIHTGSNSLLGCIYNATIAAYGSLWKGPERPCCRKPKLGNDMLSCSTPFTMTLNSGTPTATNVTFTWKRILPSALTLTTSSASATTQAVTSGNGAGTYVVQRDSIVGGFTCSRTDTIVISSVSSVPVPALGADITTCASSYTLSPSNLTAFPTGTTWKWQYGGTDITGATSSSYYGSAPGTYTLVASLSGCTDNSDAIVVSAASASPVDACRTTAGTLTLSVTGGSGPFTWYDAEIPNGNAVGTGTSFTTPSLASPSTTYYYVEDAGTATSSALGIVAASPTGFVQYITNPANFATSIAMEFNVKANVKIASVDVFLYSASTYPLSFKIQIFNSSNNVVFNSSTFAYAGYPGSAAQTLALDANLPPGDYRIMPVVVTGGATAPGLAFHLTSSYPYTIPSGNINITATKNNGQYGPFYNWQIKEFGTCKRIKVKATVAATCPTVLPVTLMHFNAKRADASVLLNWATASELNNDYFDIQRSLDGDNFMSVGRVSGAGNSSTVQRYTFTDFDAPTTSVYYRLTQHDIDGSVSYSPVSTVGAAGTAEVYLQPNPFTEQTTVIVNGISGPFTINVYSISGERVYQQSFDSSLENISLGANLASGFYVLEVVSASASLKHKFIKE